MRTGLKEDTKVTLRCMRYFAPLHRLSKKDRGWDVHVVTFRELRMKAVCTSILVLVRHVAPTGAIVVGDTDFEISQKTVGVVTQLVLQLNINQDGKNIPDWSDK
jgi:hypothetical protein